MCCIFCGLFGFLTTNFFFNPATDYMADVSYSGRPHFLNFYFLSLSATMSSSANILYSSPSFTAVAFHGAKCFVGIVVC